MGEPNWQGKYNDALLRIEELEAIVVGLSEKLSACHKQMAHRTAHGLRLKVGDTDDMS